MMVQPSEEEIGAVVSVLAGCHWPIPLVSGQPSPLIGQFQSLS